MGDCIHQDRIIDLVKATEANTQNVNNLTSSVNKMQKWLMGFIVSTLLVVIGLAFSTYLSPTAVMAKEIIKSEKAISVAKPLEKKP